MGNVWAETGSTAARPRVQEARRTARDGLRRAVRDFAAAAPDGSLFVPVRLLDPERPYGPVTESRSGSYWNLVMPYALASGLFAPESDVRERRAGSTCNSTGHACSGSSGPARTRSTARSAYPKSGTDQVYGNNVSRFLADADRPDQLVLEPLRLARRGHGTATPSSSR